MSGIVEGSCAGPGMVGCGRPSWMRAARRLGWWGAVGRRAPYPSFSLQTSSILGAVEMQVRAPIIPTCRLELAH